MRNAPPKSRRGAEPGSRQAREAVGTTATTAPVVFEWADDIHEDLRAIVLNQCSKYMKFKKRPKAFFCEEGSQKFNYSILRNGIAPPPV